MASQKKIRSSLRVMVEGKTRTGHSEKITLPGYEDQISEPFSIPAAKSGDKAFIKMAARSERRFFATPLELAERGSILSQPVEPRSPLSALRQATANIHESMHRYPGFTRLMRGSLSSTEYSALLARLYGFYFPLENLLRGAAPAISSVDLNTREKAHLLHADLVTLGLPSSVISTLPMCNSFPPITSEESVVGCLYVIEGAGRGGSVMASKLDYLLGPKIAAGRSFFLGRTAPDPFPWEGFCELLQSCAERGNLDEIIWSALGTFNAFSFWLNPGGTHE